MAGSKGGQLEAESGCGKYIVMWNFNSHGTK
jgi:hypothetical protein